MPQQFYWLFFGTACVRTRHFNPPVAEEEVMTKSVQSPSFGGI